MQTNQLARQQNSHWVLLVIVLLAFALRLYRLDHQSLWWDEVKTVERSLASLSEMVHDLLAKRHHLPFYFLLMKGWLQLGQTTFITRLFSVYWGMISLAFIYQLGRKAVTVHVGQLAAFLLAINPFHIWYSQEARMYTMLVAAVMAAHLFLLLVLKKDNWFYWLGYVLAIVTAVYTHLFALLILLAHYIFFALHYRFLKPLFLKWIGYTAVISALFAIWGLLLMQTGGLQEATPPWIASTSWYDLFLTLLSFSAGRTIDPTQPIFYLVTFIYLTAISFSLNRSRLASPAGPVAAANYQSFGLRLLLLWLIVPLLLTFFVSLGWPGQIRQASIYTDRYLIIVLPAMILLAAWGLNQIGQRKPALLPFALGLLLLGSAPGIYNIYFQPLYGREQWQAAASRLTADSLATDLIWSRNDHQLPLTYYLDEQQLQANWVIAAPPGPEEDFEEGMQYRASVMKAQANRVWLVTQFYNIDLHGFPQQRNNEVQHTAAADPQYAWMKTHFATIQDEAFVGIRLTLFDLSTTLP